MRHLVKDKIVTVRLPEYYIFALKRKFPNMTLSSAIRWCIHEAIRNNPA